MKDLSYNWLYNKLRKKMNTDVQPCILVSVPAAISSFRDKILNEGSESELVALLDKTRPDRDFEQVRNLRKSVEQNDSILFQLVLF